MTTFEVGKTYKNCFVTDANNFVCFTVVRRTTKSVWIELVSRNNHDRQGEILQRRISDHDNVEQFFPFGKYAMAMAIYADREG